MSAAILVFIVMACVVLGVGAWIYAAIKPPQRHDWTAERHRKIARNGFKSRMGAR